MCGSFAFPEGSMQPTKKVLDGARIAIEKREGAKLLNAILSREQLVRQVASSRKGSISFHLSSSEMKLTLQRPGVIVL